MVADWFVTSKTQDGEQGNGHWRWNKYISDKYGVKMGFEGTCCWIDWDKKRCLPTVWTARANAAHFLSSFAANFGVRNFFYTRGKMLQHKVFGFIFSWVFPHHQKPFLKRWNRSQHLENCQNPGIFALFLQARWNCFILHKEYRVDEESQTGSMFLTEKRSWQILMLGLTFPAQFLPAHCSAPCPAHLTA